MKNAEKLTALQRKCAVYFEELYAPEKKIIVFGDGNPEASVVMVGEAPGEQETLLRRPFVGKAGQNLDRFLEETGLTRPEMYITNAVKLRPVKRGGKGRESNRPPTSEEIALWQPWLEKELSIVRPRFLVTLGNVPLRAVTGERTPIGQAHGRLWPSRVFGAWLFPLYHPASVIYNPALKETYAEDLRAFSALLTRGE